AGNACANRASWSGLPQSYRALAGFADSAASRDAAPKAPAATTGRSRRRCGGRARQVGGHPTGANQRTVLRQRTRGEAILPLDPAEVRVDREDFVRTPPHERQRPESPVPDVALEQDRRRQRVQLSRIVVELQLPQELEAGFL